MGWILGANVPLGRFVHTRSFLWGDRGRLTQEEMYLEESGGMWFDGNPQPNQQSTGTFWENTDVDEGNPVGRWEESTGLGLGLELALTRLLIGWMG